MPSKEELTRIYNAANSIADGKRPPISSERIFRAMRAAMAVEREECAAECERMMMYPGGRQEAPAHNSVWDAARGIRARNGEKE